jgi:type IX secretion system PorP/SprF family membrane protein
MMNFWKSLKIAAASFAITGTVTVMGQDPQLSQYYNAPMYLNPALTGTGQTSRVIFNYRNQWPGIGQSFTTVALSADHDFQPINSGVGLMILRDRQPGNLTTTQISPSYSYQVNLSKNWVFRPAIQPSFVTRSTDFSGYTFGDQLGTGNASGTQDKFVLNAGRIYYFDMGAGGIFYNENLWIGLAFNHMNLPNQSFYGDRISLPMKTSIHGGYRFVLDKSKDFRYEKKPKERSITPTFNFKHQGKFDQLDLGTYFTYEPVMLGVWYRGIPIKQFEGQPNNESLIFLAGLTYSGFTFCYSYDLTISKLSGQSGGAHEISMIYEWKYPYRKKPMKRLPCPDFK